MQTKSQLDWNFETSAAVMQLKRSSILRTSVFNDKQPSSPQSEDVLPFRDIFSDGVDDDVDQDHRQVLKRRRGLKRERCLQTNKKEPSRQDRDSSP